ncbi:Ig-like domain-containing protein [Flavobacterium sp. '19STA2R22 D10 B1']|uniref:Ig-like domain-containing protein n=1 Tax=Flavobacterium aerium TaxID=3037261 RepID=UPI00278C4B63|nr:Ig-like domain-containing protein [Flavobacterium sp. '19STA2R22 D10 B1']
MLRNRSFYIFFIIIALVVSCAKRGNITGGDKDIDPPVMIGSSPENLSTDFKGNLIKIYFDEYVKLKDVQKQLIVSPPMKRAPEISPMGNASRYVTIKILDTLQPNTTYSFNFGQSIIDNNEGNPYQQFKYIFSTGSEIDSLSLTGTIKNAYTKDVESFVSVMLYEVNDKLTDSIVYKETPRYITNTLDSLKVFKLENLKEGKYLLVAMKDKNNNYKFDPKTDKIAFSNEYITIPHEGEVELKLFQEKLPFKAFKPVQSSGNRLIMGYEGDYKKSTITVKNGKDILPNIITQFPEKDSVQIWYPSVKTDSLHINIAKDDYSKDFAIKIKDQKKDTLSITAIQSGVLNFRDKLSLKSTTPLVKFDQSKIKLINKDSTAVAYKMEYDTINQQLSFDFPKEPSNKYTLSLLPGALTDFFQKANDSLKFAVTTLNTTEFGNLKITLENVKSFPVIVELTNIKGDVQASYYSEKETVIDFINIKPDLFTLRVIYDTNHNKVWDTGNYLEKRQPEEVIYFPKDVDVRANWDVDQVFRLP